MVDFLAFIFACGLGFGVAFWIAASILNKSNNFGDSHADTSYYSAGANITCRDRLTSVAAREGYVNTSGFKKPTIPLAPRGLKPVEKPVKARVGLTDETVNGTKVQEAAAPSETPVKPQSPKKNPSSFPRSFHDV